MKKQYNVLLLAGFFIGISSFLGSCSVWSEPQKILQFNEARDAQDVINIARKDWYWLSASDDFTLPYMLKNRSPYHHPMYFGLLRTKVLRENDAFVGFVSYYMKSHTSGYVLFLLTDPTFRGKGYGKQLLMHAINDMIDTMGAQKITLITRPSNHPAQALYNKAGLRETDRDETFVYFEYIQK